MKQKQSKEEQETIDLGLSAVVIGNQSIAAEAATQRFKCLKSLSSMTLGLTLGLFIGCIAGVWYIYNHSPGSLPGLPDSAGEKSYNELMEESAVQALAVQAMKRLVKKKMDEIADLAADVKNHGWLWHSHSMLITITEDDPARLDEASYAGSEKTCWDFYREHTTTARMNGFLSIVHDGNHPNLAAWYSRIQDGLTEVEQLKRRLAALMEILTDEQRDRLDCAMLKGYENDISTNRVH